jgi:hypothetical protein
VKPQQPSETAGRCWHCKVVWVWPKGASRRGTSLRNARRVRDAWCPECHRSLRRTAAALVMVDPLVRRMPTFSLYDPRPGARGKR